MQSARPGKWRNSRVPYLAGLMDLCIRRDICKNDPLSLMAFTNGWLGEPFHQQIAHTTLTALEAYSIGAKTAESGPIRRVD